MLEKRFERCVGDEQNLKSKLCMIAGMKEASNESYYGHENHDRSVLMTQRNKGLQRLYSPRFLLLISVADHCMQMERLRIKKLSCIG